MRLEPMIDSSEDVTSFSYTFYQLKERGQNTPKNPKNYYIEVALKVGKTCFRIPSLFEMKNRGFSGMRLGEVVLTCLQNVHL